jgi:two-component system chemotaxis response regulator CheB
MIVDDSIVARAVLSRMIAADDDFDIVAVAGTAEDAIEALGQVRVDSILLDLEMPGAGGLKSIPKILEAAKGARVMIVSSLAEEGAEETVAALALGATDALPKPGTGRFNGRFSEVLLGRIKALGFADDPVAPVQTVRGPIGALRAMPNHPMQLLAIGASTGGIHALAGLFQGLPPHIGVPILVTQHLPAPFMSVFARQLGVAARREAVVAADGMPLTADCIYIAPGDAHLMIDGSASAPTVRLARHAVASGCLPSVDPMLESAGAVYGTGAVGVVLTGMGRDGTKGGAKLVACGGCVLAQDEASSAVWGMPKSVLDAGLAAAVLPPAQLARRIASRIGDFGCK